MDGERASKRRRTDDKALKSSTRQTNRDLQDDEDRREELDIYDDIEGAHDPSPAVRSRRRSVQPPSSVSRPNGKTSNGTRSGRPNSKTAAPQDSLVLGSDDELAKDEPPSVRRKIARRGQSPTKSERAVRKTYEDEIKELQEIARRQVDAERTDAKPSSTSRARRKRRAEVEERPGEPVSSASAATQPADGSKSHAPQRTPSKTPKMVDEHVQESTVRSGKHFEGAAIYSAELELLSTILMGKLCRKRPVALHGLHDEYAKVSALIKQTVAAGESNSMLVIGARGCGKTTLVDQILRDQSEQNPDDFLVVRLNGFIHTDDRIALREVWRQLGRETEIDDAESTTKNYADTLTTLLALLSHGADEEQLVAGRVSKSVIFVMDEFDLFAHHPRQTLLYNLFDIAQSRKAPIAVIGLTTRVDVVESLEKRVKSRFSHRYVHLGLAKNYADFESVCKSGLSVFIDELTSAEHEQLVPADPLPGGLEGPVSLWNAFVDTLFAEERFQVRLQRLYHTTKSVQQFFTSQMVALQTLPGAPLRAADFVDHFVQFEAGSSLAGPDSRLDLLPTLSSLQLALLVCAARLNAIHDSETVTFALVYEEYKNLASKAKLQASAAGALAAGSGTRVFSKNVAQAAWAEVLDSGLVLGDGRGAGRVDVGLNEVALSNADLGAWAKWCREI